jgi:hypothetical protein
MSEKYTRKWRRLPTPQRLSVDEDEWPSVGEDAGLLWVKTGGLVWVKTLGLL